MKRSKPRPVGQIIAEMFARTGLKPELDRHKAEALWPVIAGRNIAAFTTAVRVRETTMHVYVASAPLKEELGYMKDVLLLRLNSHIEGEKITNIAKLTERQKDIPQINEIRNEMVA